MTHKLAYVTGCIVIIQISYKNLPIEIYHPPFIAIPSLLTFTCLPWLLTPPFYSECKSVTVIGQKSWSITQRKESLPHICFLRNFVKSSRNVFTQCLSGWLCTSNFLQRFRCSVTNSCLASLIRNVCCFL